MTIKLRNALILTLLVLTHGCKDDNVEPGTQPTVKGKRVLVSNEGNFQQGNASLGVYIPDSNLYLDKQFKEMNSLPVGDVLNTIQVINGEYWCVVNNSGIIHVLDSATLKLKHTISGFSSPRQICTVYDSKVYVTDLFSGEVSIVSTTTYTKTGSIQIPGWTEHCLQAGDRVYVTSSVRPFVYLIDPNSDQVVDSIEIGNSANSMLRANNATVLVLCEGAFGTSELAELYLIDPKARQVTLKHSFAEGEKPKLMRQNPANNIVYLVNTDLYELNDSNYKVNRKVVDLSGSTYAFGIDNDGNFYVGDAKDFVENSTVSIYDKDDFTLSNTFVSGINTNGFYFEK
jgi:DNA-binding beta-propeller fold protein YncE